MNERQPNSDGFEAERADANSGSNSKRPRERSLRTDGGRIPDEYIEALAHSRRRTVLYCLRNREYTEFGDLAEQVVRRETGSAEGVDEELRQSVRINLHHSQLPKLEDAGILSYDWRSGALRYHSPERVEQLLDLCASMEKSEPMED